LTEAGLWCEKTFGYRFRDTRHLDHALTHRSATGQHNERLEYLGDAVLGFIIAENLYRRLPDATEGDLSRLRASLVKGGTLAQLALDAGLGGWLKLGSGELKSGGYRRESILANALEAVIGAAYIDGGFDATQEMVLALFRDRLDNLPPADELKDPKTRLQELLQSRGLPLPVYIMESRSGEAHEQSFLVSCTLPDSGKTSSGAGRSRRQAEQEAAGRMIETLAEIPAMSGDND
jgi:ribonuclease-3